jgi:hypothetical protein
VRKLSTGETTWQVWPGERAQRTFDESVEAARAGQQKLNALWARLDFHSFDSEAGSYVGWHPARDKEAAPGGCPPVSTAGQQGEGYLFRSERAEGGQAGSSQAGSADLASLLQGWGQLRANYNGWPVFDGKYVNYPRFKKEWIAYRETFHSVMNDDLAAKTLREKCVKGDAWKMVGHLEDLKEIWDTLEMCYKRPKKYIEEALKPILEFRKYRVYDKGAVREFYSILCAAIKGARAIGKVNLLINDQTVPKIMGKMPFANWKEWATKRPKWARGDMGAAFENYVEKKWREALNEAAAEPQGWDTDKGHTEKPAWGRPSGEKPVVAARKTSRAIAHWDESLNRGGTRAIIPLIFV